jgi:transcriptional regulator with XRE-family HTH domain
MDSDLARSGDTAGSRRIRGRTLVRGEVEAVLADVHGAREAAQRDEALQLDRLAALLPVARRAGFSLEQIAEMSGVSRPTLNRLREPDRVRWSDAELAVLLALALGGSQTMEQTAGCARAFDLGQERDMGAAVIKLSAEGLIASSFQAGYEQMTTYFRLTQLGEESLQARLRHAGVGEEFRWGVYFSVRGEAVEPLLRAGEILVGTSDLAFLGPGVAGNEDSELAFVVRAASREGAVEEGRRRFQEICRKAGVEAEQVALSLLALGPT